MDKTICLNEVKTNFEINSILFDSLKSFFIFEIEFIPGKRNNGDEVNAIGKTNLVIENGAI